MTRPFTSVIAAATLAALTAILPAAHAQERIPSHCIAVAEATPGAIYLHRAVFGTPPARDTVRLSYVDHATFLLETPGGLSLATDYTGRIWPTGHVPDVVTMNNAHSTHWTPFPDPRIAHVLKGWAEDGEPADHHLDLGEMLVRNVPTDVRGGLGGVRVAGNSIFVIEAAGLCIGHLGHLHHEPTDLQYALLGRMDVVMAPVDGGLTLDLPSMMRVVSRLRSSVVLPMHWFSGASLERFLAGMEAEFAIERRDANHIELGLDTLPSRPTIVVLQPRWLTDP